MEPSRRILGFEQLKVVSDSRRMAILRLLMIEPATLSQLGLSLGETPARVRHHVKILEKAGFIEMVSTRVVRGFVEKYYRARAQAFILQELLLPANASNGTLVILGSHDLALEVLTSQLREQRGLDMYVAPIGSLEGLIALRYGNAHIAGCHLLDANTGEYNVPYVRHIFPDRETCLFTLAHREQGLLLAPGNPLHIRGIEDIGRENITIINRNRGSGTRLWLDRQIELLGLEPGGINGYQREVRKHTEIAQAVLRGEANMGIGLQAAARKAGLDFIPLFHERFDLVMPQDLLQTRRIQPLFDFLQQANFRHSLENLGGYETLHTGDQLFT